MTYLPMNEDVQEYEKRVWQKALRREDDKPRLAYRIQRILKGYPGWYLKAVKVRSDGGKDVVLARNPGQPLRVVDFHTMREVRRVGEEA